MQFAGRLIRDRMSVATVDPRPDARFRIASVATPRDWTPRPKHRVGLIALWSREVLKPSGWRRWTCHPPDTSELWLLTYSRGPGPPDRPTDLGRSAYSAVWLPAHNTVTSQGERPWAR